jgi:nuclear protein MDM1
MTFSFLFPFFLLSDLMKFRGLGGELLPEHMVDLYAKQFDVWDQVSRRSSLSALALAAVSPR